MNMPEPAKDLIWDSKPTGPSSYPRVPNPNAKKVSLLPRNYDEDITGLKVDVAKLQENVRSLNDTVTEIKNDVRSIDIKLDINYQKLDKKIDASYEKLDKKIDANYEKLDKKIDASYEKLDKKMDATEKNVIAIGNKIGLAETMEENRVASTRWSAQKRIATVAAGVAFLGVIVNLVFNILNYVK